MDDSYHDYRQMAQRLGDRGRYGDSMMMHVNPIEVAALDSMTPNGLPRNPHTGQPEAFWFLPALLQTLGSAGAAAAPALTGALTNAGLSHGLASGIGSLVGMVPQALGAPLGMAGDFLGGVLPESLGGTGGRWASGGDLLPSWLGGGENPTAFGFELPGGGVPVDPSMAQGIQPAGVNPVIDPPGTGFEGVTPDTRFGNANINVPGADPVRMISTDAKNLVSSPENFNAELQARFGNASLDVPGVDEAGRVSRDPLMSVDSSPQRSPGSPPESLVDGDEGVSAYQKMLGRIEEVPYIGEPLAGIGELAGANPLPTALLLGYGIDKAMQEDIKPRDPGYGSYGDAHLDEEGNPLPWFMRSRRANVGPRGYARRGPSGSFYS